MAKGNIAKENVVNILKTAFGNNFIGESDKKYYVWSEEDGQKVQIAIALSCPKNPIGGDPNRMEFAASSSSAPATQAPAQITENEKANIAALMESLGL